MEGWVGLGTIMVSKQSTKAGPLGDTSLGKKVYTASPQPLSESAVARSRTAASTRLWANSGNKITQFLGFLPGWVERVPALCSPNCRQCILHGAILVIDVWPLERPSATWDPSTQFAAELEPSYSKHEEVTRVVRETDLVDNFANREVSHVSTPRTVAGHIHRLTVRTKVRSFGKYGRQDVDNGCRQRRKDDVERDGQKHRVGGSRLWGLWTSRRQGLRLHYGTFWHSPHLYDTIMPNIIQSIDTSGYSNKVTAASWGYLANSRPGERRTDGLAGKRRC